MASRMRDDDAARVVDAIRRAPYRARMGGYCYPWAIAIRRALLPQSRLCIAVNDAIFTASRKKRLIGHAAVRFKERWFDGEGETSLGALRDWAMLDEHDPAYALAAGVDLARWALLADKVGVYEVTEKELIALVPSARLDAEAIEKAIKRVR